LERNKGVTAYANYINENVNVFIYTYQLKEANDKDDADELKEKLVESGNERGFFLKKAMEHKKEVEKLEGELRACRQI